MRDGYTFRTNNMTSDRVIKLQECIKIGDLSTVKDMLMPVTDLQTIRNIEHEFVDMDPINLAINYGEERIAIFLVEKGFSLDKIYTSNNKRCDQWCHSKHGEAAKCPSEYDASDNAARHKLHALQEIIDSIKAGRRRPGDGLHTTEPNAMPNGDVTKGGHLAPHPPDNNKSKPQYKRTLALPKTVKEKPKSAANEAISLLQRYGHKYNTKDGSTLLHRVADSCPAHVYVLANNGVPINIQNANGDSALHLAAKADNFDVCEALLQCCADLTLRNKMGQTPADVAEGPVKELLRKADLVSTFERSAPRQQHFNLTADEERTARMLTPAEQMGAIGALLNGRVKLLARLLPSFWCDYNTVVKDGLSLLELGLSLSDDDPNVGNCLRILHEFRDSSELIHAVLAEDEDKLHRVLSSTRGMTVNMRFRDRYGKTLLSHAIDSNNLEVVKVLVNAGARVNGVRVRDIGRSQETVPLFHRALRKDIQLDIAQFLYSVQDATELMEKDHNGNTALLRAVEEGASGRAIDWLLSVDNGLSLTSRNKNGMNARELAVSKGRSDVVQIIDKFVLQQRGKFFLVKLPVFFYGMDNLQFTDEQMGKTLLEVVEDGNDKDDIKALRHQLDIEERGIKLFSAAAHGDIKEVTRHNVASFQDKNGYTALIRAIVFNQPEIAEYLCTSRPLLKTMPDNNNRYPLHYACALPEMQGRRFIKILLERNAEDIEKKMDKDGIYPAEYTHHRDSDWVSTMMLQARTLDAYGRESSPMDGSMMD